ncbi:MAG TPA: hypothetical protein VFV50_08780 [Bdellovibrionales bacterium]|nr:hypothetical protein [Bdellovibrionales bacterium]
MTRAARALTLVLIQQILAAPLAALSAPAAPPRAYLVTESGYLTPERLTIDGRVAEVSNPLMSTYDIRDFEPLREGEPEAWRSFYNHHRYGVVGTRGFVGGAAASMAVALTSFGRAHPAIPIGLFLAGFIYGMNSRHMARHNLHQGINRLNGLQLTF